MGPHARRRRRTQTQQSSASSDSGTDEKCACGMTAIELQEMMEQIISKSFETHEEERTYEIHKTRTGVVVHQSRNRLKNNKREWNTSNKSTLSENSCKDGKHTTNGRASRRSMTTSNGVESGANARDWNANDKRTSRIGPNNDKDNPQTWEVNIARLMTDIGSNLPDNGITGVADDGAPAQRTEVGNGKESKDAEQVRTISQGPEPELGNDPQASDQAQARETGERWRTFHSTPSEWENPLEMLVRLEGDPNERSIHGQHQGKESQTTCVKSLTTITYPTPANSPSSKLLTAY